MSRLVRANIALWRRVNQKREWHKLPGPLQLLNLQAFRDELRDVNLYDQRQMMENGEGPGRRMTTVQAAIGAEPPPYRTYDGRGNDPEFPEMGRAGASFGRNHPLGATVPETMPRLMTPNPRRVSLDLLGRDTFKPATTLNVLAAAWIQFQNHDWFSHGDNSPDAFIDVDLPEDDDGWGEPKMRVRTTNRELDASGKPIAPGYVNTVTHWWDGSQIYGSSEQRCRQLRTGEGGKMIIEDGRLPNEDNPALDGVDMTGFADNYWIGLSLLHTLFAKEHNAICDYLKGCYPSWSDEQLFLTARLVNSALMAKIHTVEWTPGILNTPVLKRAMHANWYGALPQWAQSHLPRVDSLEAFFGTVGGHQRHHTAPYAITEEFASVYRLHPLIPDDWQFRRHRDNALIAEDEFTNLQGLATRSVIDQYGWSDLIYSFGIAHPGAIVLHNHPRALMNLTRVNGDRVDIGTIDILRDRERGIPRYNDFREKLRKPRLTSFDQVSANTQWCDEIRDVYDGDIDAVDLQVGLLAEEPPAGFGFSDTAFRVFILMATRRLKSDRFFTDDYSPAIYTPEGLEWIERSTMGTVLLRHHPELAPALAGVENAFAPWNQALQS